ncbi:MAG TPA: aldehyde dehydrogenase family protein [Pseudolysinimonas sp.]|nr:aldehyde dehydrogenase family protein [Pseudolysinimonas sp.]
MIDFDTLLAAVVTDNSGLEVRNPSTGELVGYAPRAESVNLDDVIAEAARAQLEWAALGHAERSRILHRAADSVEESAEALARIITIEQGKPLNGGARIEASGSPAYLRGAADIELDEEVLSEQGTARTSISYAPIGVVAAIGPWNWPVMISTWQIASALRMGNSVVLKPAKYTPLSVRALVYLLNQELPAGVLTVVPSEREIGAQLSAHPSIGKVMFTGSTATGRRIVAASANNLARLTLELGGNDPAIVLADADIPLVAEQLFWSGFLNVGQTCGAVKRVYVHADVHDELCEALVSYIGNMPMGDGLDETMILGPVNNADQWAIIDGLVEDAKSRGARILLGGDPQRDAPGYFYPATIVTDIDKDAPLVVEEQFGPALPIVRFTDIEEAIYEANRLDVGLGASVWSKDIEKANAIARRVEAATVGVNNAPIPNPLVPFGGMKGSGYGVEFGVEGLKAVSIPRVIVTA